MHTEIILPLLARKVFVLAEYLTLLCVFLYRSQSTHFTAVYWPDHPPSKSLQPVRKVLFLFALSVWGQSAGLAEQRCWSWYGFKGRSAEWMLANKWVCSSSRSDDALSLWPHGDFSTYNIEEMHILYSHSICCFMFFFMWVRDCEGFLNLRLCACVVCSEVKQRWTWSWQYH